MTIVYPIGIPAFFLFMMLRYRNPRNRMEEKGVRAQLGFLYDGYERHAWWFELVDLGVKLILSSLIAFLPYDYQMVGAMIVVTGMIVCISLVNPYLRKGDNRLHFVALVEIFLMLEAGNIFNQLEEPDELMDILLSIILIGITVGFFIWWAFTTSSSVLKMMAASGVPCVLGVLSACGYKNSKIDDVEYSSEEERLVAEAARKNGKRLTIGENYAISRAALRTHYTGDSAVATGDAELARNPMWDANAAAAQTDSKDKFDNMNSVDGVAASAALVDEPAAAPAAEPVVEETPAAEAEVESTAVEVEGLPEGWAAAKSPEGQTFYYHEVTNETTWDFPTGTA
jgi:hypothetical protein